MLQFENGNFFQNEIKLKSKTKINSSFDFNSRYIVSTSPPLPPPRKCDSIPGSPQQLRARIHYTPEPQRRIYRNGVDQ